MVRTEIISDGYENRIRIGLGLKIKIEWKVKQDLNPKYALTTADLIVIQYFNLFLLSEVSNFYTIFFVSWISKHFFFGLIPFCHASFTNSDHENCVNSLPQI